MTRKKLDASLAELETRLSHSGGRSAQALWMERNRDGFASMLARYGRRGRRWEVLAEWFAEKKILTVPPAFWSDRPEDAEARAKARKRAAKTTKTTWERVQKRGGTGAVTDRGAADTQPEIKAPGPVESPVAPAGEALPELPDDGGDEAPAPSAARYGMSVKLARLEKKKP